MPETAATQTTHTPGPWRVIDEIYNVDELAIGADGSIVIGTAWPMGDEDEEGMAIQRANQCLIAASPDLLEAARIACDYVTIPAGAFTDKYDLDPNGEPHVEFIERTLRAAIAKATTPSNS